MKPYIILFQKSNQENWGWKIKTCFSWDASYFAKWFDILPNRTSHITQCLLLCFYGWCKGNFIRNHYREGCKKYKTLEFKTKKVVTSTKQRKLQFSTMFHAIQKVSCPLPYDPYTLSALENYGVIYEILRNESMWADNDFHYKICCQHRKIHSFMLYFSKLIAA